MGGSPLYPRKHNNLLGELFGKHFEFFSIRNGCVFAVEFRHNWCKSIGIAKLIRGEWLWKAANINDKNNSATIYVASTLKVHNPLFPVGKLLRNKLMQRFYWSIQSKWKECFWTLCTFRSTKTHNKGVWRVHNHSPQLTMLRWISLSSCRFPSTGQRSTLARSALIRLSLVYYRRKMFGHSQHTKDNLLYFKAS